jgi:hypothetical protein
MIRTETRIMSIPDIDPDSTLSNDVLPHIPTLDLLNGGGVLKAVYVTKNVFSTITNSYSIFCEKFRGQPYKVNNRLECDLTFSKYYPGTYMFDGSQQFTIDDPKLTATKLDTSKMFVGNYFSSYRTFIDTFVDMCVQLQLPVTAVRSKRINQWVFRMESVPNTSFGDVLWLCRYLLLRISEKYPFQIRMNNLTVSIEGVDKITRSDIDPYVTSMIMVTAIKSRKQVDSGLVDGSFHTDQVTGLLTGGHPLETTIAVKSSATKESMEQLDHKRLILSEISVLQSKLEEDYKMDQIKIQESLESRRLNKMKEHTQHLTSLKEEARKAERERIETADKIIMEKQKRLELEETERKRLAEEQMRLEQESADKTIREEEQRRVRIQNEEQSIYQAKEKIKKQEDEVKEMEHNRVMEELALQKCILDNKEMETKKQRSFVHQELFLVSERRRQKEFDIQRNKYHIENCRVIESMELEKRELEVLAASLDEENSHS